MLRVGMILVAVAVVIYALVDLWQTDPEQVRGGSRLLWSLIVLLLPVAGAVAWLVAGRSKDSEQLPPDDNPDFLRGLDP